MSIKTGARLAQLRKENGYSQEALAEKLGLSRQAVSKWERGESSPDTDTLIELAKLYSVSLDELIDHIPENTQKPLEMKKEAMEQEQAAYTGQDRRGAFARRNKGEKPPKAPPLYPGLSSKMLKFPLPLLIIALYIVLGFSLRLWHPFWLLFLLLPAYYHFALASARASTKRGVLLGFPVIEASLLVFLILGFALHAWKWAWILFVLDVFYYWYVFSYMKKE